MKSKIYIIFVVSVFFIVIVFGGWLRSWNSRYSDFLMRIVPEKSCIDTNIVYILITQECLDWAEENGEGWPWHREYYAYLLEYLKAAGAKHIYFDFIFAEPSVYGPGDDSVFIAQILANHDRISLGITFTDSAHSTEPTNPLPARLRFKKNDPRPIKSYKGFIPLFQALQTQSSPTLALRLGSINFIYDPDGYSRRIYPVVHYQDQFFPQLAFSGYCAARGIDSLELSADQLKFPEGSLKLNGDGYLTLKYYGGIRDYPIFSMRDVLSSYVLIYLNPQEARAPKVSFSQLQDKYIFIGSSAPGLKDIRPNPFNPSDPGVHIYGTFLNNLLRLEFIHPITSPIWLIISIVLFASLGILIMTEKRLIGGIGLFALLVIGMQIVFFFIQQKLNISLPFITLLGAFIFAFFAQTLTSYYIQRQQKRFIQSAFSQLVSPVIMDKLIHNPSLLQLGGTTSQISVFFSDIAGFTSISETLRPDELIQVLNIYLTEASGIIVDDYQGYIDKYIGDAVMAFWGAPIPDSAHAENACAAAIKNQLRMQEINRKIKENGFKAVLSIRIGINSGEAIAGMMGSMKKLNYTVLGDTVNLASRLEGINKYYTTSIMISQQTRDLLGSDFVVRELDLITVKGKLEPTRIYELVGLRSQISDAKIETLDIFQQGLNLYYRKDFSQAARLFSSIVSIDSASAHFYQRCDFLIKNPPSADWDGVYDFQTK